MPAQLFEALKDYLEIEDKCKEKGQKCLYLILDLKTMETIIVDVNLTSKTAKRYRRPLISCGFNQKIRKVIFLSSKNSIELSKLKIDMEKCIKNGCDKFKFQGISYAFQDDEQKLLIRRVSSDVFERESLLKFCGTCNLDLELCNGK